MNVITKIVNELQHTNILTCNSFHIFLNLYLYEKGKFIYDHERDLIWVQTGNNSYQVAVWLMDLLDK